MPPPASCRLEHAKVRLRRDVRQVRKLEVETQVRLVRAVQAHRVGVGDPGKRPQRPLVREERLDEGDVHLLDQVEHVVLFHEAHLEVELGVLGLPVGPRVLVAEAAGYLEVLLHAGHHQQLLELLGRLRQCVEAARVEAAGHQVVARALRRALYQDGRFDFQEAALVEEVADELDHAVAGYQRVPHRGAAQVEVAVLQAQQLVDLALLVDVEGRRLGLVEHDKGVGRHLDAAGGQVRVLGAGGTLGHEPRHLRDPLVAQRLGGAMGVGRQLGVEHHLHHALAVAQVDEDKVAVVAPAMHPPGQCNPRAHVLFAHVAAANRLQQGRLLRCLVPLTTEPQKRTC